MSGAMARKATEGFYALHMWDYTGPPIPEEMQEGCVLSICDLVFRMEQSIRPKPPCPCGMWPKQSFVSHNKLSGNVYPGARGVDRQLS